MLKEEFAIYQDNKNNKTTIVIRNMSEKTFSKLTKLLLGDVKTVESISGLEEVASPEQTLTDDVTGMTQITEPVYDQAPSMADAENMDLYYPQDEETAPAAATAPDEQSEAEMKAVQDLWMTYNNDNPAELMEKFIGLYMSASSTQATKIAAGKEAGELIISLGHDRRKFCSIVWGCRNIKEFASVCLKLITQKGCGDGLSIGTEEYAKALTSALYALSDDEIKNCAGAIARQFDSYI